MLMILNANRELIAQSEVRLKRHRINMLMILNANRELIQLDCSEC